MLNTRPTDAVYARLSHLVYLDDGGACSPLMPEGWRPFAARLEDSGYVGYAYKHTDEAGKIDHIILAHRGEQGPWCGAQPATQTNAAPPAKGLGLYLTRLNNTIQTQQARFQDAQAYADSLGVDSVHQLIEGVARATVTTQQVDALAFALKLREAYPDVDLSFTGHGLGGWFAQLCVYHLMFDALEQNSDFETGCVVFDSPGVRRMLKKVEERHGHRSRTEMLDFIDGLNVMHYVTTPNLINACNEHVGTLRRIFPEPPGVTGEDVWLRNLRSRDVVAMAACFDANTGLPHQWREVLNWPVIRWPEAREVDVASRALGSVRGQAITALLGVSGIPISVAALGARHTVGWAGDAMMNRLVEQTKLGRQSWNIAQGVMDWFDRRAVHKQEYVAFHRFAAACNLDEPGRSEVLERDYVEGGNSHYRTVAAQPLLIHLRHASRDLRVFLRQAAQRGVGLRQLCEAGEEAHETWNTGGVWEVVWSQAKRYFAAQPASAENRALAKIPPEVVEAVTQYELASAVEGHLPWVVRLSDQSPREGLSWLQYVSKAVRKCPELKRTVSEEASDMKGAMDALVEQLRSEHEQAQAAFEIRVGEQVQRQMGRQVYAKAELEAIGGRLLTVLMGAYGRQESIKPLFGPPIPLNEQHVEVQLLRQTIRRVEKRSEEEVSHEQGQAAERRQGEVQREAGVGTYEQIVAQKLPLGLEKLFASARQIGLGEEDALGQDETPRLLLIQGRAGIGKTVLTRYLCAQWGRGKLLGGFEWVFHLRLRDLRDRSRFPEGEAYKLEDWVYAQYGKTEDTGITRQDFGVFFREVVLRSAQAGKVLIILDGLDEVPSHHPCEERLKALLSGASDFHVLVTSRPYAVDARITRHRRNVEVMGFVDADVRRYMDDYYRKSPDLGRLPESERLVLSQRAYAPLRSHPVLWPMSHVPVVLNMLCGVLKDEAAMDALLEDMDSLSSVYQLMECALLEAAYLKEREPLDIQADLRARAQVYREHYAQALEDLETVAFRAWYQGESAILQQQDIQASLQATNGTLSPLHVHQRLKAMRKLGLLHMVNEGAEEGGSQYEFLHLSFQEYFAGRYLVRMCREASFDALLAVVAQTKCNPRYQVFYWMAAGQLKGDQEHFDRLMQALWASPRDIFNNQDVGLMVRCCDEAWEAAKVKGWVAKLLSVVQEQLGEDDRCLNDLTEDGYGYGGGEVYRGPLLDNLRLSQHWLQLGGEQDILNLVLGGEWSRFSRMPAQVRLGRLRKLSLMTPGVEEQLLVALQGHANALEILSSLVKHLGHLAVRETLLSGLLAGLKAKDMGRGLIAVQALGIVGQAATPEVVLVLLQALKAKHASVRRLATDALAKMGEYAVTPEVVSALVQALENEDEEIQIGAIGALDARAAKPEIVSALVQALNDESRWVRRASTCALGKMGERAAKTEVLLALVHALEDEEAFVRSEAAYALGAIGEAAARTEVLSVLVHALKDEEESVRSEAAYALGAIGEAAARTEVLSALVQALNDKNGWVRRASTCALSALGERAATAKVVSALVQALGDKDVHVRAAAAQALGEMDVAATKPGVASALVRLMRDENEDVRAVAAEALGVTTPKLVSALAQTLYDRDMNVRLVAAWALGEMGGVAATEEVVSTLIWMLENEDEEEDIRTAAVQALGSLGGRAVTLDAISALVWALNNENSYVRTVVAHTLGKMGAEAAKPEVLSALINVLGDQDGSARAWAAQGLGKMGEAAAKTEVVSALLSALGDKDEGVRAAVAWALGALGERAAKPVVLSALISALGDQDGSARAWAAQGLGKMGEAAAKTNVVSALVESLKDREFGVRSRAAWALGALGERAAKPVVLSALISALGDDHETVRAGAGEAIVMLGQAAHTPDVVSALLQALGDKDRNVRSYAALYLRSMEVLSPLVQALRDENQGVRVVAAEVLGKMGERAVTPDVLSALVQALRDENQGVRVAAAEVLGKMGERAFTPDVLSALVQALGDEDKGVRVNAADALSKMGEQAASSHVVSALVQLLGDKDGWYIRASATQALAQLCQSSGDTLASALRDTRTSRLALYPKLAVCVVGASLNHGLSVYPDVQHSRLMVCLGSRCLELPLPVPTDQGKVFLDWLSKELLKLHTLTRQKDAAGVLRSLGLMESVFASEGQLDAQLKKESSTFGVFLSWGGREASSSSAVNAPAATRRVSLQP